MRRNVLCKVAAVLLIFTLSSCATWFVEQMQPYPQAMIQVQGFTDSTGSEATNAGLSSERATNVTNYPVAQGIGAARITTQGFGSNYAAGSNVSSEGRRNNRRVEVTVR